MPADQTPATLFCLTPPGGALLLCAATEMSVRLRVFVAEEKPIDAIVIGMEGAP